MPNVDRDCTATKDPLSASRKTVEDQQWAQWAYEREINEESSGYGGRSMAYGCLAWFALFALGFITLALRSTRELSRGNPLCIFGLAIFYVDFLVVITSACASIVAGIRCLTAEGTAGRVQAIAGIGASLVLLLIFSGRIWGSYISRYF